jgi:hypothetical protein
MTVDLCTKSCTEIGQPLAALNYGTVSTQSKAVSHKNKRLTRAVFMWTEVEWRSQAFISLMWSALCRG